MSQEQIQKLQSIKKKSIWSIVLIVTLIPILIGAIMSWVCIYQVLSTKWENSEVEGSKTLWGILSIFILGPIGTLIFASQSLKK
ncbi:MAG: hypothetical protein ACRC4L_01935 [Mycoplasma sp.]